MRIKGVPTFEIKRGLMYGNGCYRWGDCFSCPYPECDYDLATDGKRKKEGKGGNRGTGDSREV